MTRQFKQILIFSILALSSYAVWKIFVFEEEVIEDKPFTKGYSVDNLELRITDDNGKMSAKFNSPSLIRYTDSDVVMIKSPILWTYEEGNQNWQFKSKIAEYNHKLNQIKLIEKVKATSLNDDSIIKFTSNDLSIDLHEKSAQTQRGISVVKELFSMTGNIANFNFKNKNLEVRNNVKVIYKNSK